MKKNIYLKRLSTKKNKEEKQRIGVKCCVNKRKFYCRGAGGRGIKQ